MNKIIYNLKQIEFQKNFEFSKAKNALNKYHLIHIKKFFSSEFTDQLDKTYLNNKKKLKKIDKNVGNLPLCFCDKSKNFSNPIDFYLKQKKSFKKNSTLKRFIYKNAHKFPNIIYNALKQKIIKFLKNYYNNQKIVSPYSINVIREVGKNTDPYFLQLHQDLRALLNKVDQHKFITIWISLDDCELKKLPGLKFYLRKFNFLLKTKKKFNRNFNKKEEELLSNSKILIPKINKGDIFIFKSLIVHGTNKNNSLKSRRSIDLRFFPHSSLPRKISSLKTKKFIF